MSRIATVTVEFEGVKVIQEYDLDPNITWANMPLYPETVPGGPVRLVSVAYSGLSKKEETFKGILTDVKPGSFDKPKQE